MIASEFQPKLDSVIQKEFDLFFKTNKKSLFGSWVTNILNLRQEFLNAKPFPHLVIDNFLSEEYASQIERNFPEPDETWHEYNNPIEVKYSFDRINELTEPLRNFFYLLSSSEVLSYFQNLTNIQTLEADPFLNGAGLHAHGRQGRLNIHLDYERHPLTNKQRRLNVILYINRDWEDSWNGHIQLWNKDMTECQSKVAPLFNRAVIFQTNDISWHGLPDRILCPEGNYRKSLAYYYVSPFEDNQPMMHVRTKAKFIRRPQDPIDERMEMLYKIRPQKRISKQDMQEIWPEWTKNLEY